MDIYAVNLKNKNYSFELFNELIESKTVQNIIDRNRYNDYKILGRYQNNSNSGLLFNTELTNKLFFNGYNVNFLDLLFISAIVSKTRLNSYINFLMTPNKYILESSKLISFKATEIKFSQDNDPFIKNRQIFTLCFVKLVDEYLYKNDTNEKTSFLFNSIFNQLNIKSFEKTLKCSMYNYFTPSRLRDIFDRMEPEILNEVNIAKEKIMHCFVNSQNNLNYFLLNCNAGILNNISMPLQDNYLKQNTSGAVIIVCKTNNTFNNITYNQENRQRNNVPVATSCFTAAKPESYEVIYNMEECEHELDNAKSFVKSMF